MAAIRAPGDLSLRAGRDIRRSVALVRLLESATGRPPGGGEYIDERCDPVCGCRVDAVGADPGGAGHHAHPRGCGRFATGHGVFENEAVGRLNRQPARCFEEDVRSRLSSGHFLGGDDGVKASVQAEALEVLVEAVPFSAGGEPDRQAELDGSTENSRPRPA